MTDTIIAALAIAISSASIGLTIHTFVLSRRTRRIWRGVAIAAAERAEKARAVHQRAEDGGCSCGWSWPCETIVALDGGLVPWRAVCGE